ncbi:bifunctional DnaQ family exonuclease/ATP-dependent helicase [Streptococcus panodentis]|uniref:3'-5' exonuclease DinG n=2 Tax=Streptococcus TaxID=1301 RepID=A0ABS5AVA8_9STRE|nr:bifunctional DnaQ family exonuclease/ATP-dependent helicase [Streptococcus panodentis]MBP2620406.1 bifunctional DnaQ family exonuclease/ATP-dependent helicase [Streptococcus panodentis]
MTDKQYKYAVVDLEATGANSSGKIIQIGIVIIENGAVTQIYETDVNPHQKLDEHIKELTGLDDRRLRKAPEFSQVAREVYDLIHDAIFVAHNVKFDANFLAEALFWEGFELLTPRVDTVELAQVFYPSLDKYSLGQLCRTLAIPLENAHTALADAQATAQLFLKIQEKIRGLPKALVEKILDFGDSLIYESRLAIEEVYQSLPNGRVKGLQDCQGIFLKKPASRGSEKKLSQDFLTNLYLLGLEERPEQLRFAHFMEEALDQQEPSFLQAQTGLGKTFGYLLPILARRKERVLVTVPTKVLQDQLLQKEGRILQEVFGLTFHSLKSPDNYLKLDRFYDSLAVQDDNRLTNRCKMQLLVWLTETETGDLNEIGQAHRFSAYFSEIRHDGKLSRKSLFYQEDFWRQGQVKAAVSRVVITNHAYLLTRLEDDQSLLDNRILVVDEAQKLFFALESFSQASLNLTKLLQQISQLLQTKQRLVQERLLQSIQFELAHAAERQRKRDSELQTEVVEKLRQDVSELDEHLLPELQAMFSPKYQYYWLTDEAGADYRLKKLHAGRSDLLRFTEFLPETAKVILVSSTLEISSKVNLAQLLGFETYHFYKLKNRKRPLQKLFLNTDFPNVTDLSSQDFAQQLAVALQELAALGRPIVALFTSRDLLLATSEQLSLPHLAQYKNGDASNIKRRFDRAEANILLGSGSFWEGADFAEQEQIVQVITRLPFDNPKDFFVQKINSYLKADGKNSFYDYQLPLAILRLKQAIGRTRRNERQKSAVILLDNRILTKRYGKQIQHHLSQLASFESLSQPEILQKAADFFDEEQSD